MVRDENGPFDWGCKKLILSVEMRGIKTCACVKRRGLNETYV